MSQIAVGIRSKSISGINQNNTRREKSSHLRKKKNGIFERQN
jgi:hypothetical protein